MAHFVLDMVCQQWYGQFMSKETSHLRQSLVQLREELNRQLDLLVAEQGPLVRGSFGTRSRKCGNPNCRCTRGELHQSKYLTATDNGRVRQVHVPAGDEVRVAEAVERYRRFHSRRMHLAELANRQLELVDALGRSLLEPYPADNPLPAAKRRGRPPKPRGGQRDQ